MPAPRNSAPHLARRAAAWVGGVVLASLLGCRDTPTFWDASVAPASQGSPRTGLCYCWASPSMRASPGSCTPVLVSAVDPKTLPMCTPVTAPRFAPNPAR